ncbi:hypothetical protein Tco_0118764 [Tanacetum coccineum]
MIEGNSPKWMFDINSLTQSMNYILVTAGTVSNDSAGTSEENSQDCIVMPIWKDTSYFDSPNKDVDNGEPKTVNDAQKQVEDGPNNENAEQERFANDSSTKDVNADGQHINTASPDVNTSSLKLNVVGPSVNTASPDVNTSSLKLNVVGPSVNTASPDVNTSSLKLNVVGPSVNTASPDVNTSSLKLNVVGPSVNTASPNEQDSTEEEPEVDLGNITNSYIVSSTPNTRIRKDCLIDNVIGEVKSTV